MIWDIQKYNQEKRILKSLAQERQLSLQRKEELKQSLLSRLDAVHMDTPGEVTPALNLGQSNGFIKYFAPATAVLLLCAGTAYASSDSLPGESLYAIKRAVEKFEYNLAPTTNLKAKLAERHAIKRIEEFQVIQTQVVPTEAIPAPTPEPETQVMRTVAITEEKVLVPKEVEISRSNFNSSLEALNRLQKRFESRNDQEHAEQINIVIQKLRQQASAGGLIKEVILQPVTETTAPVPQTLKTIHRVVPVPGIEKVVPPFERPAVEDPTQVRGITPMLPEVTDLPITNENSTVPPPTTPQPVELPTVVIPVVPIIKETLKGLLP